MLVFRVQTDDNTGPYGYGATYNLSLKHNGVQWPVLSQIKGYYYGFSTIKQLKRWFDDEDIDCLHNENYSVYVYRVKRSKAICSKKQVAFDLGKAVKVGRIPMNKVKVL